MGIPEKQQLTLVADAQLWFLGTAFLFSPPFSGGFSFFFSFVVFADSKA
jgi:hypothetical protein